VSTRAAALLPIRGPMPQTEAWHAARKSLITASIIPAILGRSKYKTALDVFLEMTGRREPFAGNAATRAGNRYEPAIIGDYCDTLGVEVEYPMPLLIHPSIPCLAATPDAMRKEDGNLVEAKKTESRDRAEELGEEGTDRVPEDWLLQGQAQMSVCGASWVHFAVFLYGGLKVFKVDRHPGLIHTIERAAVEMSERITNDDPPEPNYEHDGAKDAIKALYALKMGAQIDFTEEAATLWAKRQEAQAAESEAKKAKEAIDAEIMAIMQGAEMGWLPEGGTIRRGAVAVPEKIVRAYSYERLWYSKPKKGR
jgi:putative phage-type endonuclease